MPLFYLEVRQVYTPVFIFSPLLQYPWPHNTETLKGCQSPREASTWCNKQSHLLVKPRKVTMQIHSLNIACDRKSQPEYSNMVPQGTVRGRNSPATIYRRMFKGTARGNTAAFWPHLSPGAHSLHASPSNLSTTMRSPARQKASKDVTNAKPPTSPPSSQPAATSGKKLGVGFKSP